MGNIYSNNSMFTQLCCKGCYLPQFELEIQENHYNLNSLEEESNLQNLNFDISNIKEMSPISKILETSYKDSSFERSRLQKLEKAIYYAKVLRLSIHNAEKFEKPLIINALGCETSQRLVKDGFTYFGAKKKDSPKGQVINDVTLPFVAEDLAQDFRGRYFQISYDLTCDTYNIQDLKLGFGIYYKLVNSVELKNNTLFMVGETYVLATLLQCNKDLSKVRLKIYGRGTGEVFYFSASDCQENFVTVGRLESCDVRVTGGLISKVHCTVFYTPEKGWVLVDGDVASNQASTNGTWVYVGDKIEVFDSMVIKSGRVLLKISIL